MELTISALTVYTRMFKQSEFSLLEETVEKLKEDYRGMVLKVDPGVKGIEVRYTGRLVDDYGGYDNENKWVAIPVESYVIEMKPNAEEGDTVIHGR